MEMRDDVHDEKFVQCYLKYNITVARYLRLNFIGNFAEALEMSHEIFVKLYEQNVDLDPCRDGIYTYLVRIARNHAIDTFRKKKSREAVAPMVRFEDAAVAARIVLETLVFWAVHRHWDPSPQAVDESSARRIALAFLTSALAKE